MWCVSRISENQEGVVRGISCVTELKSCSSINTFQMKVLAFSDTLQRWFAPYLTHYSFLEAWINSWLLGKNHLGDNVFFDCVHSFVPYEFGRYLPVGGGQTSTCEPVLFYPFCRIVHFQICRYDNSNYQLLSEHLCMPSTGPKAFQRWSDFVITTFWGRYYYLSHLIEEN